MKKPVGRNGTVYHDHRGSVWLIAGGSIIWCYACGAWRPNVAGKLQWHKPSGDKAINPAMKGRV